MTCGLCGGEGPLYLCEGDARTLARRLADLPALYSEVGEYLVPRRSGWGEIVATRGAAGPRSPLDEDILDTINWGTASEVMGSWRLDVQRVRWPHYTPPPPAPLDADCRWLAMELEWIVANYPVAGELASEVRQLERQARAIVGDPVPEVQRLGTCVAVVDDEGAVCGAPITRVAGQTRLACRKCRTAYQGELDLILLRHYQPVGT